MKYFKRSIIVTLIAFMVVSLSVSPISAKTEQFKDVHPDSYNYEAIIKLSKEGIMGGFPDGTFKPEQKVTRAQTAIVLAKLFQLELTDLGKPIFTDVATNHAHYKEIAAVAKAGIMKGDANKTFKPNSHLTRAEMAEVLVEAFKLEKPRTTSQVFKDVPPNQWYADSVQTLVSYGITSGMTSTTFGPNLHVTRGELAVFIIRAENIQTTIAGSGQYDSEDGKALEASFRSPSSIALLNNGSMLVSDSDNHLIRQISKDTVSTFAGMILLANEAGQLEGGLYDGKKESALFSEPSGISLDADGNIYVADSGNHAIRKISATGEVSTIAGNGLLGHVDGQGEQALLYSPQDVAVTKDGIVYVADTLNHVIRKIDTSGQVTTLNAPSMRSIEVVSGVVESTGDYKDGKLSEAKFNEPSGLALDSKGNLYVSDTGNQLIRYIDFTNNTVSTVAGKFTPHKNLYATGGYKDGKALQAQFSSPKGIFVTSDGGLLIADRLNHAIRYLKDGQVQTIGRNFNNPTDVVQMNESILVVESFSNRIQKMGFEEVLVSSVTSNAASTRTIEIKDITGKAFVQTAGGLKTIRAVTGMQLKQGDRLQTDEHSSVVLVTPDTKDIVTIGDKTDVSIAQLQSQGDSYFTTLRVWVGSVYSDVTPLENSKNTFRIDANGSHFQAKGTHFIVNVNPLTGKTDMLVASGLVQANRERPQNQSSEDNNRTGQNSVVVYPSQQINLYPQQPNEDLRVGIEYADVGQIAKNAPPKILENLLKNAADIQNEIEKQNQQLQQQFRDGQQNPLPNSDLRLQTPEDLKRVQSNIDNLLAGIIKEAVEQKKLNSELIDEVNNSLAGDKKLDLNNVPAIDRRAGMDPEVERLKEEQRKVQQQKVEEKERQLQDNQERLASLLEKIEQDRKRLEDANKKAQEEAQKRAEELLKASLTGEERRALEQRTNERVQERTNQENASRPPTIPTPTPTQPPSNDSGGGESRPPSISGVNVVHTGSNSFELRVTPHQAGMIHYVVLPSDAPAPNPSQIKDGLDGNGEPALISATQEVVSGREAEIHVGELEESSSYTIYVVAEDGSHNLSRISRVQVETIASEMEDLEPPNLMEPTPIISFDYDGNGLIDHIFIAFNEELMEASLNGEDVIVEGYEIIEAKTGVIEEYPELPTQDWEGFESSRNFLVITISEDEHLSSTPAVTIAENVLQDLAGNYFGGIEEFIPENFSFSDKIELQTWVTTDSITLEWDNSAGYDDIAIVYENKEINLEGSHSSYRIASLNPGTSYTIRIEFRNQTEGEPSVIKEVTLTTSNYYAKLIDIDNGATIGWGDMGVGKHYADGIKPKEAYKVEGRLVDEHGQPTSAIEGTKITVQAENANGTISDFMVREDGSFNFIYQSAEQGSVNNSDSFKILFNGHPTSSFWTNSYKAETSDSGHQLLGL